MSADSLSSADASKTFASFASDINLITEVPTGLSAALGRPCRRIRINTAGSGALAIQYANGSTDTITGLSAGDVLDVKASKILETGDGTSVGSVTVFW